MTPDQIDALSEQVPQRPVAAPAISRLANITVTKADGRVINLGRPTTIRYRYRLWRYKRSC